ncbi:MAG: DUF5686 and carboxypeptidase regulatory-like domain-containing protein [Bacteroidia bacterium]
MKIFMINKWRLMRRVINSLLFIFSFYTSNANSISGKVTDEKGEPLAFANVYLKGTTKGTTSNIDGNYKIELPEGKYEIVFKYIGYKMLVKEVIVNQPQVILNVALDKEQYSLKEVVITAGEDPAYAIIRNAIRKRKFYLEQVDEYSSDVYIKGLQRLVKWPKKILGQKVELNDFVDSVTHIIYLSESVSKFNFKQPDQIREEMISSKVSGNSKAFSWNQASDMLFNFYQNLMETGISPRGVVSPISSNALFYYKYRLEGTYFENNVMISKISVIPKRKNDPVFKGTIYIQDSTWRIHSLDLFLTKESQIQFVDTLGIKQVFVPMSTDDSVWMPASNQFTFHFSVLGFEGNGNYVGIFSNYNFHPAFAENFFKGEVMKVNDDANKKDTAYWNTVRPVPLTNDEEQDYVKKDSAQARKESKPFLDSLDRKTNKISAGKILLTGYNYRQRYKKQTFNFSPLIQNVQFNTVEGLNFSLVPEYTKTYEDKRKIIITPFVKYGISNETFSGILRTEYKYNRENFSSVAIEGGKNSVQFNNQNPISPIINTTYSLFGEKNYMKIYTNTYGLINYKTEITNGININTTFEFAERTPLVNHTDYAFKDISDREYSSNNPLNPANDAPAFEKNQSLFTEFNFRFRIKQKYISRPEEKIIIGSKYPTFSLIYKKGFHKIFASDVDYDLVKAGVDDELNLGLLGSSKYELYYGKFLNHKAMYFMDYQHFSGNLTAFSSFDLRKFNILDYYSNSTNDEFVEGHFEHDFGGFIFNKIPLLRRLKLNEIAGFDYLHVKGLDDHFEISFGLSKLDILRIDFVAGFTKNSKTQTGIRICLTGL